MPTEIERKFLIRSNDWEPHVMRTLHILDYLVARFDTGKARIRICGEEAILTFKGQKTGVRRGEYHLPLEKEQARVMIDEFVVSDAVEKNRHEVEVAGVVWQVDEYLGALSGFVTADVELPHEDHRLGLPAWAGPEITNDARFGSSALTAALDRGEEAVEALFEAAMLGAKESSRKAASICDQREPRTSDHTKTSFALREDVNARTDLIINDD